MEFSLFSFGGINFSLFTVEVKITPRKDEEAAKVIPPGPKDVHPHPIPEEQIPQLASSVAKAEKQLPPNGSGRRANEHFFFKEPDGTLTEFEPQQWLIDDFRKDSKLPPEAPVRFVVEESFAVNRGNYVEEIADPAPWIVANSRRSMIRG
jgi:hypothetical protein